MSDVKRKYDKPEAPGWYPTVKCWDVDEGMFPGAHYWDGQAWKDRGTGSISYWPIVFPSEKEAEQYARDHDPEAV